MAAMITPNRLPATKTGQSERAEPKAVQTPLAAPEARKEVVDPVLAQVEQDRETLVTSLRNAQAAAERAVIDATLELGEAVEALYTIERNLDAEGLPVETPDRVPGPVTEAVRRARRFWREWYPQLVGPPRTGGDSAQLEQARRRLARAQEGLHKSEEAGDDERFLQSWRETIELEKRNIARLEGRPIDPLTSSAGDSYSPFLGRMRPL